MNEVVEPAVALPEGGGSGSMTVASLTNRRIGLWGGAVLIIALLGLGGWWLYRPSYVPLLKDLSTEKREQVLVLLAQWKVPYRTGESDSEILVPGGDVDEVRARLDAQGVLYRERAGLEVFEKADHGMSEFAQRINYQRALEGELERTIQAMNDVRAVRVHLTLGKSSIFETRREIAKGAVLLQFKPDQRLSGVQIRGIQQLVASAVTDMQPEQVTVLDGLGQPLASLDEGSVENDHLSQQLKLESMYEERARRLVAGFVPNDEITLSVRLRVNFDKVTSVKEELIPVANSVGGYLVKSKGRVASSDDKDGARSNEAEYAYGRERAEIQRASGVVERVHVGVLVGRPMSEALVRSIEEVMIAGLGISSERGDTLAVVGTPDLLDESYDPVADEVPAAPDTPTARTSDSQSGRSVDMQQVASVKPTGFGHVWKWSIAGAVSLLLLALAWSARTVTRTPAAGLSDDDREQLLIEARRWLGAP